MKILTLAALAFFQPAPNTPLKHASLPPIQSHRFVQDLHDKNIADVLTLYTPKAVFVDPDGTTYRGLDQIQKLYEKVAATYDSDLHISRTSLGRTGTFAIEHGTYTETLRTRATGQVNDIHGTYVFVHERQPDGRWLLARQTWTLAR